MFIENLSWQEIVKRYDRPHTLFFLDPPYWQLSGYGAEFTWDQYEEMAIVMRSMKGKAILTINDHPDIAELFQEFRQQKVGIQYSVGQVTERKKSSELIICNW